jgi:antitoxin ParD1/3/4
LYYVDAEEDCQTGDFAVAKSITASFALGNSCQTCNNAGMPTKNVNLSEKQARFIRQRITEGRYRNASEVVRAGLRVLEQSEREDKLKLMALRKIARKAFEELDAGKFETIGPGGLDEFMASVDAKSRASRPR